MMFRLKEIRTRHNISQFKLSELMGVSRSAVSMWESGASQPDYDMLIKLADFFDCSTDYLLGRVDYPKLVIKKAPPESGAEEVETEMDSPDKLTTEEIKAIRAFLENMKK